MATIRDILVRKGPHIISGPPETTVGNAVRKMVQDNIGSMVVVDGHRILGIFTERDLLFRVVGPRRHTETTPIGEVMSTPVLCCRPDDDIRGPARLLLGEHFRHLVVAEEFGPVGVISLRDVLRADLFDTDYGDPLASAPVLLQSREAV